MLQTTAHHIHYHQPDSNDYHISALCIALGHGMTTPGNNQPLFWRTPGYPIFVAFFYRLYGITSGDFYGNLPAQQAALFIQLILCSCIPLIILFLAHFLSCSWILAWICAWISVVHIGFVLASTYLLTEGISMIFFYLFLLYFFKLLLDASPQWVYNACATALMLSLYTWIRPMGECVGMITALLVACGSIGTWKTSISKSMTFFLPFFTSLLPWYWRNYLLTGDWFYCPLSGIYLNAFCAPKILRRTLHISLLDAWKYTQHAAHEVITKAHTMMDTSGQFVSPLLSKTIAIPIIMAHPFFFCYDWIQEVCKTAFDLYAHQLIRYAQCQFWFDPLEELLSETLRESLWTVPAPLWMRAIAWIELCYTLFIWIGLIAGCYTFCIRPWFTQQALSDQLNRVRHIWIIAALMSIGVIGMTGGFGYARLRLPIEPLLCIGSLLFWNYLYDQRYPNLTAHTKTALRYK